MSKDMKMKIAIEGDNSGFRQTLQQTGRDMKQFQSRTQESRAVTAMDVIGIGAAFKASESLFSKMKKMQSGRGFAGLGAQKPGLAWDSMKQDLGNIPGQLRRGQFGMARTSMMNAGRMAGGIGQASFTAAIPGVAGALTGGLLGGAIAAAAAAALLKLGSAGKQQLQDATQFSAGIQLQDAMKELRDTQRAQRRAENPMLMEQQSRLRTVQEWSEQQDAVGLGYVATEAQIFGNELLLVLKWLAARSIGADAITEKGVIY